MYLNEERARGLMADFGFDAIIASTPENLTYLAGTVGWSNKVYAYSVHMFAVFARDEGTAPAIIVPGQEVTYVSAQQSWIKDLYTFGGKSALIQPAGAQAQTPEEETYLGMYNDDAKRAKNPGAALALALKERGLTKARLALDQERVTPNVRAQIEAALPDAEIVDAADFFRLIRMVKTPDEIAALAAAAEVNEKAGIAASNAVAEGATEREVASVFAAEVGRMGGKWQWFHFCSGRRATGIFPPTDKKIAKGEMWKFDAGRRSGQLPGGHRLGRRAGRAEPGATRPVEGDRRGLRGRDVEGQGRGARLHHFQDPARGHALGGIARAQRQLRRPRHRSRAARSALRSRGPSTSGQPLPAGIERFPARGGHDDLRRKPLPDIRYGGNPDRENRGGHRNGV